VQRQLHTPYRRMLGLLCCSYTPHVYPQYQPRRGGSTLAGAVRPRGGRRIRVPSYPTGGCHYVGPPGLQGKNLGLVLVCSLSSLRGHDALRKSQVLDTMRSLVQRQIHTPYRRMPGLFCRSYSPHVYPPHQPRRGGSTPCRGRQAPRWKKRLYPLLHEVTNRISPSPWEGREERAGRARNCLMSSLRAWNKLRERLQRVRMRENETSLARSRVSTGRTPVPQVCWRSLLRAMAVPAMQLQAERDTRATCRDSHPSSMVTCTNHIL